MIVMPTTYSPMTVARAFRQVEEFEISGRLLHVIYDPKTPRAAIIEADIEIFEGVPRHRVVAALDLQRKPTLVSDFDQYDGGCIPEERIWSLSPDQKCRGVVLVAENKQRANQMMEESSRDRI